MAAVPEKDSFWGRLIRFLAEVIEAAERLTEPGNGRRKKQYALELVVRWHRRSGIRIPYLPGPIERFIVRRIASGMIDALVDLLKPKPAEGGK